MPTLRMWCGKVPYNVTGKLVRDTGTGLIIEDERGVRYYAPTRDVIQEAINSDLFAEL